MLKNRFLILIVALGIAGGTVSFLMYYHAFATSEPKIKVMAYKPSAKTDSTGYQIDKCENIQGVDWVNDYEIVTLTKKGEHKNPDSTINIRYCSIYNLNTKKTKDYKAVNIADYLGISSKKKYILYKEANYIPKIGSKEWRKAIYTGDLFHVNVKLLNLTTGEIKTLNTKKSNSNAEFRFISDDKILINYLHSWSIVDLKGKIYAEGSYKAGKHDASWIAGSDDIKDLGNKVEGKFYYSLNPSLGLGTKLCTMDIKTKTIKKLFSDSHYWHAKKEGNTIIIDNYNDNGKATHGVYLNRTFGAYILDAAGKLVHSVKLPKGRSPNEYILSPDGSKAAYVEYHNSITSDNENFEPTLKIIDTKTGTIKELVKESSLMGKNNTTYYADRALCDKNGRLIMRKLPIHIGFSGFHWDSTSTSLLCNIGSSYITTYPKFINTYVISLDR